MNFSTLFKGAALAALMGAGAVSASAQTFVYDGVIYKASGQNLTAQKAGTAVTVGEAGPAAYTGDIKVPLNITYNGKTYKVTSIAAVFKGSEITSIDVADGVTTISRGAFQGCLNLTSAKLPADLVTAQGDLFNGCTALKEITIPGTVKEWASNQLKDCKALSKITIAAGTTPLEISAATFGGALPDSLVEVIVNRPIGVKYTAMDSKPFRGVKTLQKVSLGGDLTDIPTSYFENCSALSSVEFTTDKVVTMGTNVFAGSGLSTITLPASITSVTSSCFMNCRNLNKVVLGAGVTKIDDMAFYNSTVSDINLPEGLKVIGALAFQNSGLSGVLQLPSTLTSLGNKAFFLNAGLTSVSLPASLSSIGSAAFGRCNNIASYDVAADNAAFAGNADKTMVTSKDGSKLVAFAPACAATSLTGNFTSVAAFAAYGAKNLTSVDLPMCTSWDDEALRGSGIKTLSVKGSVGRYVSADCPALTEITIDGAEVPYGIGSGCTALTKVSFKQPVTTIKSEAFAGATALKSLDLGAILAIIEADAFKGTGIENMTVSAANPAAMAAGVFTADHANITLTVPNELVAAYSAAEGWKNLKIAGSASLAAGPSDMGMPAGLYFANPDGKLYCAYEKSEGFDSYDVGGVPHTFQLAQFKNRIYGACAGTKFMYSATGSTDGDGKLFYISKVGGKVFQAVVLDNKDGNAYADPFALDVYGDSIYVNDRNVCIRKISANAIALPRNYPSWVENNWMGFYGPNWAYGCIKAGWAILQSKDENGNPEPEFWQGMKYNGNGIYRFKEKHIGKAGGNNVVPANSVFLTGINPIFTTFFIDEKNRHMYIYLEKAGSNEENWAKAGLYRIDLDVMIANPEPSKFSDLNPVLVDGAPVKYEGGGANEHVGISQLTPDENKEYMYWCYRAPSQAEADVQEAQDFGTQTAGKYWWAEKFDATNPLHQTGIKRIKLGEAQPKVEMVVPGAEGYGCVPVNYVGSSRAGVETAITVAPEKAFTVAAGVITAIADVTVTVYDMTANIVGVYSLRAGESATVNVASGSYIATGNGTVAKFVK